MTGRAVRARAARLLASGVIGGELLPASPRLTTAIPVMTPDRRPMGWIVGAVLGTRVAGFAQFDRKGGLVRYASLQRRPGSLDGCPEREAWCGPQAIAARAASAAQPGERLGKPFLSFDRVPDRLAWIVPARSGARETVQIFVAGDAVYRR